MKKLKVIIIGCGNRGAFAYAKAMNEHPEKFEIVAIAEPVLAKRNEKEI